MARHGREWREAKEGIGADALRQDDGAWLAAMSHRRTRPEGNVTGVAVRRPLPDSTTGLDAQLDFLRFRGTLKSLAWPRQFAGPLCSRPLRRVERASTHRSERGQRTSTVADQSGL